MLAAVLVQAPAVRADGWSGICFFNQDTMPCLVSTDPYELRVLKVAGDSVRLFNPSTDSFSGPENGADGVS